MSKNITIAIVLISFISAGIGYAIYSAPERPEHLLFKQAIKQFTNHASSFENQFRADKNLTTFDQSVMLDFIANDKSKATIPLQITTQNNTVTLRFGEGNSALANQTIILEPFVKKDQFRWKCINGSVLIRFRSKSCRLGLGITAVN